MNGVTVITPPEQRVIVTPSHPTGHFVSTPEQPVNVTVPVGKTGPKGPKGDDAQWDAMTQAEYDALPVKDSNTLYVIVEP